MNEWLVQQGIVTPQTGLLVGLLAGLVAAVALAWLFSRRSAANAAGRLQTELDVLEARLEETRTALTASEQQSAVLQTRLEDREKHHQEQVCHPHS